jgi:hypothetical protein
MPGVSKHRTKRDYGRAFPASHYDDPRGGRASALERNILRYRATEATLYLFYAEEVRDFMLTDVHRAATRQPGEQIWEPPEERRLQRLFADLLREAETEQKLLAKDAEALRRAFASERQQGKKLKVAFAYAVTIGMFTEAEAAELRALLDYRNDIVHRIQLLMSDISRDYWAIDHVAYAAPTYKGDALDRLRSYRRTLRERAPGQVLLTLTMDSMLFEFAEHLRARPEAPGSAHQETDRPGTRAIQGDQRGARPGGYGACRRPVAAIPREPSSRPPRSWRPLHPAHRSPHEARRRDLLSALRPRQEPDSGRLSDSDDAPLRGTPPTELD